MTTILIWTQFISITFVYMPEYFVYYSYVSITNIVSYKYNKQIQDTFRFDHIYLCKFYIINYLEYFI